METDSLWIQYFGKAETTKTKTMSRWLVALKKERKTRWECPVLGAYWVVNSLSLILPTSAVLPAPTDMLSLLWLNRAGALTPQVQFSSVQFISIAQLCPSLHNPMDCSMPCFSVHHQLPDVAQTHVHWVSFAIQPSHPLSSPSPTFSLSQHQDLFKWVSSSNQMAKVLELQLQHQFFQWIFRTDFL